MKSVKISLISFIIFLLGVNISFAQSQAADLTDEQKQELAKNMEEFVGALNLSEEQKPEFEAITKKYAEQMIAVKNDSGGKLQKYRKVKSIRKNKNAEMEKLLSKNQYEIYLEKQEEMQKKMKERRS